MPSYLVTKPSWLSSKQELRENGHLIGEMTMLKKLSYAVAKAQISDRTVFFGYKGWTTRNLFIQDSARKDIATVKSLSWWKRDTAVTIDGKYYKWKQKNCWATRYGWFASDEREIMEFRVHWWGKHKIYAPLPLDKTEILLLFFGMYLVKLQEMEAVAAGA